MGEGERIRNDFHSSRRGTIARVCAILRVDYPNCHTQVASEVTS
jgi:hypothetical protein